jgi:hypothetical protein
MSQHPTVGFVGKTYNSPFTENSTNLFPVGVSTATQPALPAIQSEGAATPVATAVFVKVQPHEKGTHFSTTKAPRPIVYRAGGPAKTHDTAATPNHPALKQSQKPATKPVTKVARRTFQPSFLQTGGTLSGHATASTNHSTPRWNVTKTGAAG